MTAVFTASIFVILFALIIFLVLAGLMGAFRW